VMRSKVCQMSCRNVEERRSLEVDASYSKDKASFMEDNDFLTFLYKSGF